MEQGTIFIHKLHCHLASIREIRFTLPFGQYSVRMSTVGRGKSIHAPTKRTVFSWQTSRACLISHSSVDVISTWNIYTIRKRRETKRKKNENTFNLFSVATCLHRFHSICGGACGFFGATYLFLGNFLDGNAFAFVNAYSCEHMCWRQRCAAGNRCSSRTHTNLLKWEILLRRWQQRRQTSIKSHYIKIFSWMVVVRRASTHLKI